MRLLDILSDEKALLLEMIDILRAEKESLINDDINKLQEVVRRKEELKFRIDGTEDIRITTFGEKRLKEMIPLLKEDERDEAESLGKDIENAVYGIQEINDVNCLLIKQSLNYVRAVMNIMSPPKVNVYNSNGAVNNNPSASGMLDRSI